MTKPLTLTLRPFQQLDDEARRATQRDAEALAQFVAAPDIELRISGRD